MNKFTKISKQFVRYFGAALVGYVIDFGTLILLHEIFHVHYLIAASTGFIAGLCVLYALSNKYVFGQSKLSSKTAEFVLFTVIGLIGLVILNAGMWLLTDVSGLNYILSKILATILVYIWNFLARCSLYHDK